MSIQQLTHEETQLDTRNFPLYVVCDDIIISENVGAIFRICEAMGVAKLVLLGDTPTPPNRKIRKSSRSTDKYVPYEHYQDKSEAIANLKVEGFELLAVEITNQSIPLSKLRCNIDQPIALILGSEKHGISEQVLKQADRSTIIEMFGKNSSMNVVSALSIALYEITRQFNQ